jgi:DMSO/TMAO reductase YedYZ molybdopterin-dependent catalytic subunit
MAPKLMILAAILALTACQARAQTLPRGIGPDAQWRLSRLITRPTLVCRGYYVDVATWAGASLSAILELARPKAGVKEVTLVSADGYESSLSLDAVMSPDAYLAYELEGRALPVLHGFPLRAVLPSQTGSKWVKWLVAIRVGSSPTRGGIAGVFEK